MGKAMSFYSGPGQDVPAAKYIPAPVLYSQHLIFLPSAQEGNPHVVISEGCPGATGAIIAISVAPPPDL